MFDNHTSKTATCDNEVHTFAGRLHLEMPVTGKGKDHGLDCLIWQRAQ